LVFSRDSFEPDDGIFEAKIKFNPLKEVVNSFLLQGKNHSRRVHLLEMGTKNRLGIAHADKNGKMKMKGIDISNLKKNRWYIFTLEKAGSTFTWKINDTEVLKIENQSVDFPFHLNLLSIVVYKITGFKLPSRFETDWVKCYRKK
jgi:hypothetical protein